MFKQYKRTNLSEMTPYQPVGAPTHQDELEYLLQQGVSISQADISNGSPKIGDMIARNSNDHNDLWLVAEDYFNANFELK